MMHVIRFRKSWGVSILIGIFLLSIGVAVPSTSAITAIPDPNPIPGSYGLQATKPQPPPTQGASIATPGSSSSLTASPTTVNGICPNGLLVQVSDNKVLVGAVMCQNGSFSMQISLFAGNNELSALVYDDLGQAGPISNIANVTYTDNHLTAFGQLVTLTSSYGRRSAAAGSELDWPLQLSGGTGPYALSIDWGDGSSSDLKSQSIAGLVNISHTYQKAGIYNLNVQVTDANGVSAFLQLVAVASGEASSTASTNTGSTTTTAPPQILWIPTVIALILLLPTYWLGRRSQLISLRNKMLKERDSFKEA